LRNIKLIIAFDGTNYSGWQRQKEPVTIQGVLEDKISLMANGPITLHGAGRTDAGVHALGMVANFNTDSSIPCVGFMKGLNSLLPADIRILRLEVAPDEFHARFSARGKSYLYQVITSPLILPTMRLYYTHFPGNFNYAAMNTAMSVLIGRHDFSSFEAVGSRDLSITGGRGAVRKIYSARILPTLSGEGFTLAIHGDGFLRHMVRNIVGTVVDVGIGKKTIDNFAEILYARERSIAGATAPACGLFLQEVFYEK
jgi:tRNA pseudouridine38-40 synthase